MKHFKPISMAFLFALASVPTFAAKTNVTTTVAGRVKKVVADGLIVEQPAKTNLKYSPFTHEATGSEHIPAVTLILVGHPDQDEIAVGDSILCYAYRDGAIKGEDDQPLAKWVFAGKLATKQKVKVDAFGRPIDPKIKRLGDP